MLTLADVLSATKGKIVAGKRGKLTLKGVSTDSRSLKKGELFVAIIGENLDGHDYIIPATKKGAAVILVDHQHLPKVKKALPKYFDKTKTSLPGEPPIFIVVPETLLAYQQIAAKWRKKFKIPVIGITGSAGKTTTKDFLASILAQKIKVLANEENFNNEIGVPQTLLRLRPGHQAAVVEMAAQKPGEIKPLAQIVRPTIAIITCIGEAHLEFFKTKAAVAKTKAEIFAFMRKGNPVILNADDAFFQQLSTWAKQRGAKVVGFGFNSPQAKVNAKDFSQCHSPIPGKHNQYNALAAIAAAKALKLSPGAIVKGIENARFSSNRTEVIELPYNITLINDCYNANPTSVAAALKMLSEVANLHLAYPVAILGDQLELGSQTIAAHKKIGALAKKYCVKVIGVGKYAKHYNGCGSFKNAEEVIPYLHKVLRANSVVLVKGSRGVHLERIVEAAKAFKK